ncbi:hypothetical protein [Hymenobacter psoromatis]|uniref:hypothetical protein n=1 Tax=Hymenobacter psoromatis TaxID=1484116 RepID=UPI001CBC473A|nr:hypothetical protein [Hymenobacter psoromatis]
MISNDFEHNLGWGGAQPSLTIAWAHSGQAAVLAEPQQPFSYTFARTLGELAPGALPYHLELTGWVLRTAAGSTGRLHWWCRWWPAPPMKPAWPTRRDCWPKPRPNLASG